MQKTPWFCVGQADVILNYLPLKNVLTLNIKATVKNEDLPDSAARPPPPHLVSLLSLSLSLFLSLSLADLALSRLVSRLFSLTPFILRVPPGSCRGWTPATMASSPISLVQFSSVQSSHVQLFVNPWTATQQASLSITTSWSLLKLMFMEWVMPSCFARCPNPQAGREKASKTMQLAKKGKFITDSNQGSCRASNTVVRGQRALSRGGYPNL